MSGLPKGWEIAPLLDIAALYRGVTYSKADSSHIPFLGSVAVLRANNLQDRKFDLEELVYVPGALVTTTQRIRKGDVVIATSSGSISVVGKAVQATDDHEMGFGAFCGLLRPSEEVYPHYFGKYFYSDEYRTAVSSMARGVNINNLKGSHFESLRLPIPPLAEQKRIADKLEALLARVDACRERLVIATAGVSNFRKAVVETALRGDLTKDWRATLTPSQAAWEATTIGNLLTHKPRNGYSPRAVDIVTKTRSLTLSATTSGRFKPEHCKYIDEVIPEESFLWLKPGDILIQRANTIEYVGVSAVFLGEPGSFIYPDLMMKCRANARTTTLFLHLLLQGLRVRSHFRENATGTAGNMPKINQETVVSAPVSLPPLPEQHEIVRRAEELFAFADRIEARLARVRAQLDRLTPALLAKAFRGELVPQDPNDEPASVLLERVRAERAAVPKKVGGRGRKRSADK